MNIKRNTRGFSLQQERSDCGVACLLSVIRYYGGHDTLEHLRRTSGTTVTGTTLLGLYQAAKKAGFTAEGCEADVAVLRDHPDPVILHICTSEGVLHYIICYGTAKKGGILKFIIGDPAKGILYLSPPELEKIWISKTCLVLKPGEHFQTAVGLARQKRQWIINLIKTDLPLLGIASAIGFFIAASGLVMALFSQCLIDDILPKKDFTRLVLGVVLVLLLLLFREGLSWLRQEVLLRQSTECSTRLMNYFFTRLLQLPKPFFDTRTIGELTARLNDTARIQRVISQLAGNVIIDALATILTMVFLFSYSWKLGVSCLLALPVYFILIRRHHAFISGRQRNVMSCYARSEAGYISSLQGIESIKNLNKQDLFAEANKSRYQQYQAASLQLGKTQIRLSLYANSFAVLFLVSVLLYAGSGVLQGQLKTGQLMAVLSLCATLLPGIANLALIAVPINEARIAFDRMFEFTSAGQENNSGQKPVTEFTSLRLNQLFFRFPGRSPLLKNISLEIRKGECIALMGKSGSGKSTLLQLLQGNYAPENGTILVNGETPLEDVSLCSWRKVIGSVPQHIHLFNGTVLENIAFEDASIKPQAVLQFLEEYHFSPFIESLPQSYATLAGEEGINLSGGQKQLIGLARALYQRPKLLILDEATAALDYRSEQFVLQLLLNIKKETAIFFVTHRPQLLQPLYDRIYTFEEGTVRDLEHSAPEAFPA